MAINIHEGRKVTIIENASMHTLQELTQVKLKMDVIGDVDAKTESIQFLVMVTISPVW